MHVSRRTMVRSLSALAAGSVVPGFFAGIAYAAAPPVPNLNSIFILFEGPWIIDEPVKGGGSLRATTFGKAGTGTGLHQCFAGFSNGTSDINNPPGISTPLLLASGQSWTITPSAKLPSRANTLVGLFDVPFKTKTPNDAFIYLRNKGKSASVLDGSERIVNFPTPDKVYVGGRLKEGGAVGLIDLDAVVEADPLKKQKPMPHVAFVFEYIIPAAAQTTLSFKVGSATITVAKGQHFVFRMEHTGGNSGDEPVHIHDAFAALVQRIGLDPARLALQVDSSDYVPGSAPANFTDAELGLGMSSAMSMNLGVHFFVETTSNCGGGGFVAS